MKKRILSGLLLMATVAVGFSTFTSCKDTDEDLRTEFTSQQMSLQAALDKLKGTVEDIKSCDCTAMNSKDLEALLKQDPSKSTIESWINAKINELDLFGENGEGGKIDNIQKDIESIDLIITNTGLDRLTPTQATQFAQLVPKAQDLLDLLNKTFPEKYDDTELRNKISTLESTVKQLNLAINGDPANNVEGLLQKVATMQTAIDLINGDITDVKGDITTITGDVSDIKLGIATINTDITGIQGDITDIKGDITNINGNITTITGQITDITGDIASMKDDINTNKSDIATINGKITTVEGNITTIDGKITTINDEMVTVKDDISTLQLWFSGLKNTDGTAMSVAQFQENVQQGEWVKSKKASLEAIITLLDGKEEIINALNNKDAINALNTYYLEFEKLSTMYGKLFPEGMAEDKEWWSYETMMTNITTNKTDIENLQKEVNEHSARIERLENNLDNMVTSLLLQTTTNPLFGSINTPFGVNSMVLMAYYGKISTGLWSFPASNQSTEYCGDDVDPAINSINWSSMMANSNASYEPIDFDNTGNLISTNDKGLATLGTLWFTVNPTTVAKLDGTFTLVNSVDKEVPVQFETVKDNETVFKFGFASRSAEDNGLYRAEAYINPAELDNIKINIEPGLKDALVDAVKNRTVTDIAQMLKTVYNQLQNICDANALRYTWESYDSQNEDGTWNKKENKVYTNYGLAATAFKPLSFHTLYGSSFRKLPHIGNIEINKNDFKFDFGKVDLGDINLELDMKFESVSISDVAQTMVKVKIPARYELKDGMAVLPDNWETGAEWSEANPNGTWKYVEFDIAGDLNKVIGEIRDAIDTWVYGDDENKGFNDQIEDAVNKAIESAFNGPNGFKTKIENQIKSIEGNIQDKVDDLVNKINKDYLNKVNNFVGKVNKVSDRINNVLSDPNHYLQAMMMYKDANGNFHMLSTDPNRPSQFKGNGEAIELFATTYNFETICPVFKKFVGVNKVTTANGAANPATLKANANVADNYMGTVFEGDHQRVALNVKGATKGVYTYEIAYQALDFHGYTSTVKCYIQVIR